MTICKFGHNLMRKLLPLVCTTTTTLTSKYYYYYYTPILSLSTSSLQLDSYYVDDNIYSKNKTLNNLIKSGHLNSAHKLFDEMRHRDVVTYNMLISGHGRYRNTKQALNLYNEMVSHGILESASTFSSVLSICSDAGLYKQGIQVHCRVISFGFGFGFGLNLYVGSSLVDLYLHMGLIDVGLKLFDELPERNLAVWNLMLRWVCEIGRLEELFGLYYGMKLDGVEPNGLSFCYLIRACCDDRFLDEGKQLHCLVIKVGLVEFNLFVANALVDFYSACGNFIDARISFEAIPVQDVISWNSIVSVYANNSLLSDAIELFSRMQFWGKRPSIRSIVGFLNSSSGMENILFGKQIHCYAVKMGFDHESVHVQSALINMYGKCGDIESSVSIYDGVPRRTLKCCNSLMTSLLHCGIVEDVVEMFGLMVDEGIGLDEVTLSTTLKAISGSASASFSGCRLLHCCAIKTGFEFDIAVSCSLIDAYSRGGQVELSRQVFEKLPSPNVICFTSILNGYARNGMGREVLGMLEAMIQKGLKPDKVTFLCVLAGCNHSGMVEEGQLVFKSMKSLYGINPDRRHYSCMVDLLGRAGLLEKGEIFLQQAPGKGDCVMWSSFLRSCRVHRNEIVGRRVAKILMELEPEDFAVYLQMSNFYSEIGEFEASMQIREIAMARKVKREIGCSLIEVNS